MSLRLVFVSLVTWRWSVAGMTQGRRVVRLAPPNPTCTHMHASAWQSALAAADASIQQLVGQRETDLKSKIKADMKTVEDEMVAKVRAPCCNALLRFLSASKMCAWPIANQRGPRARGHRWTRRQG